MNTPAEFTPIDLWLAGSKGHAPSAAQQASDAFDAFNEGRLIRALFQERADAQKGKEADLPISTAENEQRHWLQILERIRGEDMFKPLPISMITTVQMPNTEILRSTVKASNQRFFALIASVAVLAVGLTVFMQQQRERADGPDAVILRGDEVGQRIAASQGQSAKQLADQIEAVLKKHHLVYRRVALDLGGVQIQAKVSVGSAAGQELKVLGLMVPEHGRLNVMVVEP